MRLKATIKLMALAACGVLAVAHGQWVEDSIDVGGAWVGSMVYNSREDVVYGLSNSGEFVFAISCDNNEVISRVDAFYPRSLSYDPADNKLYCSFGLGDESLLVINGATHRRTRAFALLDASLMVWDALDNRLFVSCTEEDRVSVIDCATDSVIAHVPVGNGPLKMHLNTLHHKLYVQNSDAYSVSIVNLSNMQVIKTVSLGVAPRAGYYNPAIDKYYCDAFGGVKVIDGATDTVLRLIPMPANENIFAMAGYARTDLTMMAAYNFDSVYTVDGNTDSVISAVPVGGGPQELFWSPQTELAYCANYRGTISVIGDYGVRVVKSLPVASSPFAMAYSSVQGRLYVGHLNSRKVYVIRDSVTGIVEAEPGRLPHAEMRAYPSPFRGEVTVEFSPSPTRKAEILVFNSAGRLVAVLTPMMKADETAEYRWDGRDEHNQDIPAGVYCIVAQHARASVKVVKEASRAR